MIDYTWVSNSPVWVSYDPLWIDYVGVPSPLPSGTCRYTWVADGWASMDPMWIDFVCPAVVPSQGVGLPFIALPRRRRRIDDDELLIIGAL